MNNSSPISIALDAMGGDHAPAVTVEGTVLALAEAGNRFTVVLVGDEAIIKTELARHGYKNQNIVVHHASEVVSMDDSPTTVLRSKPDSSIVRGLELHRSGSVNAFVSAGNTGAMMSASTLILGRITGVARPTIGSTFPTETGMTIVFDVGANVDAKPRHLYEFAVMGSIYASQIFNYERPKVGLLNIGEEETKGNELALATYELLKRSSLNFVGNVEGRDILKGSVEVVVCDGFTGNIVLKFAESVPRFMKARVRAYAEHGGIARKLWVGMIAKTLKKVLSSLDYQEYGGVPLLGVNGVSIIGHGSSSAKAIKNMILKAEEMVAKRVNERIANALQPSAAEQN